MIPRLGPCGPGQACDTQACRAERQDKQDKEPRRQPKRTGHTVEDHQGAAMRIEPVERLDERVAGVKLWILPVQKQGQPVRLIAVEAVISAQGEIEPQHEEVDQPARQFAARARLRPQGSCRRTCAVGQAFQHDVRLESLTYARPIRSAGVLSIPGHRWAPSQQARICSAGESSRGWVMPSPAASVPEGFASVNVSWGACPGPAPWVPR